MAFVNELISDDDKKRVDFNLIKHSSQTFDFEPRSWCIDRSRDAFFLRIPRVGRPEPEDPETYALVWKGSIVRINLKSHSTKEPSLVITWELVNLSSPDAIETKHDEVINLLKDALNSYKSHGLGLYGEPADPSIIVRFQF